LGWAPFVPPGSVAFRSAHISTFHACGARESGDTGTKLHLGREMWLEADSKRAIGKIRRPV
jgi:hypothetical protein